MSDERPYEDLTLKELLQDDHGQPDTIQAMAYYLIDEVDHLRAEREVARLQARQLGDSLYTYEQRVYQLMYDLDEANARNDVLVRQALEAWE